ncbi:hypothetical protein [Alteromonas hispanica]|uniref:Uncharacterized protein n=1 Tax=Alteromonas hispanica TaxID=315421 RepID=A0A6L9MRG5_9ALTE|nr:hypothetical protein [Alteromonas hispanica]NDW20503.1 hypothetical protein [Alteromonas hispanica]
MKKRERGFVLTIELILIITILVIGSFAGIVMVRDALFKRYMSKVDTQATVVDANNTPLGIAVGFDEHQAPLIFYFDREGEQAYRTLIGIRDDRFTSREAVYYNAPNCQGDPCIKGLSDETSDSRGTGQLTATGNVSYLNALQGGPNYAIGFSGDVKGQLLRSTALACPAEDEDIQSRYVSQKVVAGTPCEPFSLELVPADSSCLVGLTALGDSLLGTADVELSAACSDCPSGYESQNDIMDNYLPAVELLLSTALDSLQLVGVIGAVDVTLGEICCPVGTKLEEDENIVETLVFTILEVIFDLLGIDLIGNQLVIDTLALLGIEPGITNCQTPLTLFAAETVNTPGTTTPAFSLLQPPFRVTLPQAVASFSDNGWQSVSPTGEGSRL